MNSSTVLARLTAEALRAAGVGHVILCPGSRSAPLAYELQRRADAGTGPRLHVRHDERVAGFTALGVGAAGGLAAVVTTSGTAVANLHPAVLEAHHAGVPLVVLSADRPRPLRGTWANQTSELQSDLFGAAVRTRIDLADTEAVRDPGTTSAALAGALRAALGTRPARPGPVHVNLGFTDPLVPDDVPHDVPDDVPDAHLHDRAGGDRPGVGMPVPGDGASAAPDRIVLPRGPRTVVVAGDRSGPAARLLAESAGWPLLAEPSSGARAGRTAVGPYRLLLELPTHGGEIERVVAFGRPTLSRPVTRLLAREDVELVLVSPYGSWPDPGRLVRRARSVEVDAAPENGGRQRATDAPPGAEGKGAGEEWLRRWVAAGAAATRALDRVLETPAGGDGTGAPGLSGPLVARELAGAVGEGEAVVVAASNAVRDLDLAARPWSAGDPPAVLANRGLSGIDGTLSTATGVALATGGLVRVLVGDLAFLHDLNALLPGPGEARAHLQVVVLNDDGGGIFSLLEHGERAGRGADRARAFEHLFGTPHGADLAALCRGYAVPHRTVEDVGSLRRALAGPPPGTSVLEVRVARAGLRDLHARIRAAVHEAARAALAGEVAVH